MAFFDNSYNSGAGQFSGSQIGGGFVSNTQENNFNMSNISTKPQLQRIPYDQRKLSQVTIKQIQSAAPPQPDEHLIIDNVEISQLQMIAQIRSIDVQSTHTTLKVNDYTGQLDIKQWQEQSQASNLSEGTWVRIVGRINHFQGRCSVNAFDIIPITNFDEITHHFLECICSHLLNTMPKPKVNNNNNNNMQMNNNNQWNNSNNNNNNNNQWNNNNNNNNMQMNNNNNNNNNNGYNNNSRNNLQNQIVNIINRPEFEKNEQGCNVQSIFQQLSNENIDDIRTAIDELAQAGYIYSTVDDEHYKYSGDQQ